MIGLRLYSSMMYSGMTHSGIQFFPSNPFINCLYSRIFPVVIPSTVFILRGGLRDGLEAQLIYYWTRCYNLEGTFIFLKTELVLSIEEVVGWWLDLNLGDGEEKGIFWRSFGFDGSKISAMFLCCRGYIVKILCNGCRNPWRCINGFWNEHPWEFKSGVFLWFYCRRGIGEDGINLGKCLACDGIRWWK